VDSPQRERFFDDDEMQAEWDARQAEISFFLRQAEI